MNDLKKMQILENDRARDKRYCKCGHSVVFPKTSKTDKMICSFCGKYIFKNDLLEFEYRIKEKFRKKFRKIFNIRS